jgi:uncharacterized membrane protein HdeD (DUF308 family)
MEDGVAIAERDWLICGLLWIVFGTIAVTPFGIASRIGRVLFALMLVVHTVEAVYVGVRARMAGLDAQRWFLRTMIVGALGMMKLEAYLRKVPGRGMAG